MLVRINIDKADNSFKNMAMAQRIFFECPYLRSGFVCSHVPAATIACAATGVPRETSIAAITEIEGESVFLRAVFEDCSQQHRFHVHYDIGFGDAIKPPRPVKFETKNEAEVYFPFGGIESSASVQFTFAIPMQEIPIGSLVSPLARPCGAFGVAFLRSGEYQLPDNQTVKRITFQIQVTKQQPCLHIGMHANLTVRLGATAISEAFERVYEVFQSAILAKARPATH